MKSRNPQASGQRPASTAQPPRSAESQLDALLHLRDQRLRAKALVKPEAPAPAEVFRRNLENDFSAVLDELAAKYVTKGLVLDWDFTSIIAGGREMTLEFSLPPLRTTLRGTLARDVVAFEITRSVSASGGEVSSGPMLRLRTLDKQRFREFVCEQIALMIRALLRVTRR